MRLYKTSQGWTHDPLNLPLLAPIDAQEIWAARVTYYRSRTARMAESEVAGGGSFYDRVYSAERPELFSKALAYRVAGPGDHVRIRRDSKWDVPEPELALVISPEGKITGYTIGNDMSSRDIEGENPLYLPQAKAKSFVEYLYRETSFPNGCILLTGTGIVPPESFTLEAGDEIAITIEPIGTLRNTVAHAESTFA